MVKEQKNFILTTLQTVLVVCLIIFILVKRQKSKNTVPDSTAETYKSSSPQLNKNINSLMNYINQWISSIKN